MLSSCLPMVCRWWGWGMVSLCLSRSSEGGACVSFVFNCFRCPDGLLSSVSSTVFQWWGMGSPCFPILNDLSVIEHGPLSFATLRNGGACVCFVFNCFPHWGVGRLPFGFQLCSIVGEHCFLLSSISFSMNVNAAVVPWGTDSTSNSMAVQR